MKKFKKYTIISLSFVTILISSFYVYYYINYIHIPKNVFSKTVPQFFKAAMEGDKNILKELVTRDAVYRKAFTENIDETKHLFNRFLCDIEILGVSYVPNLITDIDTVDSIWGSVQIRAKIDSSYRYFTDICLLKRNGKWKVDQFIFPDIINY